MSGVKFQIRLGLVLYGGISLAVYMNGMTQELLALVRASHARRMAQTTPDHPFVKEQQATNPYYRLLEAAGVEVVIDVIAGTSAGGLNGLILAKALAAGAPDLGGLSDLWKQQAQIWKLATFDKQPVSLLSGEFLMSQLEQILQQLSRSGDPALAAQVEVLDLFVTATDVRGHRWTRRDTFNQEVQGLAHGYFFHLKKRTCDPGTGRSYDQNDFVTGNRDRQRLVDRVLAKVGQATAALPPAFPPVRIGRAEAEAAGLPLLADVEAPPEGIWFSDGGLLMNRPFEPVVQTVARRSATVPYKRVLAFLEAAPEAVEAPEQIEPTLMENAIAGLTLTREQDIADDLERLAQENQHRRALLDLVEAMDEAAGQVAGQWSLVEQAAREALSQVAVTRQGGTPRKGARGRSGAIPLFGSAAQESPVLQSYYAMRQARLRETFKEAVAQALTGLGLSGSRREGALRAVLAQVPLLQAPASDSGVAGFLARFDAEYHQRRLHFLLTRIQRQYRPGVAPSDREAMCALLEGLWGALEDWRNAAWTLAHAGRLGVQPAPWGEPARQLDRAFLALAQVAEGTAWGASNDALDQAAREAVAAVDAYLSLVHQRATADAEKALAAAGSALPLRDGGTGEPLKPAAGQAELTAERLVRSYGQFESRDLLLFPLRTYTTTSEWEMVELMRLGADGARAWVRKSPAEKITGTRLGYFGAFLDGRWRSNDIMWGRLDAAELLTRMVVMESGLLTPGVSPSPDGEMLPESAYAEAAREALAARRRQILADFPELINLEEVRRAMVQGGAALHEGEPLPDWALQRYLQHQYRITPDGLEGLPPERLAGEILILLHNLAVALERSSPGGAPGTAHKALLVVLRPLNWVARLILIPRAGLLGIIQSNAASVMTLVGLVLLVLHLFGAVQLRTGGWGATLALLAPAILDGLFRPTPIRLLVAGALAAVAGGAALAQAHLPVALGWLEPLQQALAALFATLPAWVLRLSGAWGFFACLFGALLMARVAEERLRHPDR